MSGIYLLSCHSDSELSCDTLKLSESVQKTFFEMLQALYWVKRTVCDVKFTATQRESLQKEMESIHPVHLPWNEITSENDVIWELPM